MPKLAISSTSGRGISVRTLLVWTIALTTLVGCETMPHRKQRAQAEANLNQLRAQVKYRLAVQAIDDHRVDKAIPALLETTQLDPGNALYHRKLATCYLDQGQLRPAADQAELAESLGDASAELAYVQGMIAEQRAQLERACRQFRLACSRDSENVDYLLASAECLVRINEPREAISLLSAEANQLAEDPRIYLLSAHIAVLLGDDAQAATDFANASELVNESPWDAEQYALVLTRLGRYAAAAELLAPIVQPASFSGVTDGTALDPSSAAVRTLATCYVRTGRQKAASKLLTQHLEYAPNDAKAWWLLTEAAMTDRDWETARRCARSGDSVAPSMPQWRIAQAYISLENDDLALAIKQLNAVLSQHPNDVQAQCLLGEAHRKNHDLSAARRSFQTALDLDPQNLWASSSLKSLDPPADR